MALTDKQVQEIQETLSSYTSAYEKRDLKKFRDLLSPDAQGFGSGEDEQAINRNELLNSVKRDLSQADNIQVKFADLVINGDGRVAWAMGSCIFDVKMDGQSIEMGGRITLVLRNNGARWLFEQIHFSMPFSGQKSGQSFGG